MLPPTLPLFPLPNVVLFPNVFLPLHIFEPRYRDMVADALGGDRIIGMVLLRPGWERDYEGRPPVYPVGCAGLITHSERLSDGRYNIVLRGLEKFRVAGEDDGRAYRVARVESIMETVGERDREVMQQERRRLETLLVPQPAGRGVDPKMPPSMADEDLINALAQYLELEPVEKQALLERDGLLARCRSLIELLEMKVIVSQHKWGDGTHYEHGIPRILARPPAGRFSLFLLDGRRRFGTVLDVHVADDRHGAARRGGLVAGRGRRIQHFAEQAHLVTSAGMAPRPLRRRSAPRP